MWRIIRRQQRAKKRDIPSFFFPSLLDLSLYLIRSKLINDHTSNDAVTRTYLSGTIIKHIHRFSSFCLTWDFVVILSYTCENEIQMFFCYFLVDEG